MALSQLVHSGHAADQELSARIWAKRQCGIRTYGVVALATPAGLNSNPGPGLATARTATLLAAIRQLCLHSGSSWTGALERRFTCYSLVRASPRAQPRKPRVSPGFAFRVFDGDLFVALRPLQLVAAAEGGLGSGRVFQFT